MSVTTSGFARSGFTTTLTPPRPGIYYTSVAVYNALTPVFLVQNGVNQNSLSAQTAQLYAEPTTGSSMSLQAIVQNYPYGSYLGPLTAVWFEPTETPGSYPVTLGALAGLVQWTPLVLLSSDPIYVVPGAPITSVTITSASDTSATITVTGLTSSSVLGSAALSGSSSVTIPLTPGTGDTVFIITSSADCNAIVSLFVGVPPEVSGGGSVVPVYYASLTGPGETATPGALTQAGDVTIDGGLYVSDLAAYGINLTTESGFGVVVLNSGGVAELFSPITNLYGPAGAVVNIIPGTLSVGITIDGGAQTIQINVAGGTLTFDIGNAQVSGGTLAGVIAGLVDLGLFSS